MKKTALVLIIGVASFCLVASAFAGGANLRPGDKTACNDAKSSTFTVSGTSAADRTNGNAVVWKSSNATTVPVTIGPGADHGLPKGSAGAAKTGMSNKHTMGRKSVTFYSQPNFSRGDSIGDISGEVRITNVGTNALKVACN